MTDARPPELLPAESAASWLSSRAAARPPRARSRSIPGSTRRSLLHWIAWPTRRPADGQRTAAAPGPPDALLVGDAGLAKPDQAVVELAELLHRHLIGAMTVNAGADAELVANAAAAAGAVAGRSARRRRHRAPVGDGGRPERRDPRDRLRRGPAREARPGVALDEIIAAAARRRAAAARRRQPGRAAGDARRPAQLDEVMARLEPLAEERGGRCQDRRRPQAAADASRERPEQLGSARAGGHAAQARRGRRAAVAPTRCSSLLAHRRRRAATTAKWSAPSLEQHGGRRRRAASSPPRWSLSAAPPRDWRTPSRRSCPTPTGGAGLLALAEERGRRRRRRRGASVVRGTVGQGRVDGDARTRMPTTSPKTTAASCGAPRAKPVDVEQTDRRSTRAGRRVAVDGERRRAARARSPAPAGPARDRGGSCSMARRRRHDRGARRRPRPGRLLRPGVGAGRRDHPARAGARRARTAFLVADRSSASAAASHHEARRRAPAQRRRRGLQAVRAAVPRDRHAGDRAARRSAVGRAGRALATAAA